MSSAHETPGPSQRQLRVAEQVRHILAETMTRGKFNDPVLYEGAQNVTVAEVNAAVKAAQSPTVGYTEDPIVSTDVIGIRQGTLFDARSTKIMEVDGKQLVKVFSWYDNESSFTAQMIRSLKRDNMTTVIVTHDQQFAYQVADRRLFEVAQGEGMRMMLWTLNTEALLAQYSRWPVDALITDYPERAP